MFEIPLHKHYLGNCP